jgi:hypothetical protein
MHCHQFLDVNSGIAIDDTTYKVITGYAFNLVNEKSRVSDNIIDLSQVINNDSITLKCSVCALRTPKSCTVYTKLDSVVLYSATYVTTGAPDNHVFYTFLKKK